MSARYLLPCNCGQQLPVDVSQSGLTIPCACGAQIIVPRLRELRKLAQAAAPAAKPPRAAWGPRQGMVLIGVLVALIGTGVAGYFYYNLPRRPTTDDVRFPEVPNEPQDAFRFYQYLKRYGLDTSPSTLLIGYERLHGRYLFGLYLGLGVTAVGVLLAGLAFLVFPAKRPTPRGRPLGTAAT